jgi:hypothetical protein
MEAATRKNVAKNRTEPPSVPFEKEKSGLSRNYS